MRWWMWAIAAYLLVMWNKPKAKVAITGDFDYPVENLGVYPVPGAHSGTGGEF